MGQKGALQFISQFGMIKLGSRTELIVPEEVGLKVFVKVGQKIQAGTTILAGYESAAAEPSLNT